MSISKKVLKKLTKRSSKNKFRQNKEGTYREVVYTSTKKRYKEPEKYNNSVGYDFLQHIRLVYRWATKNHDITRNHLEILLYLHPMGLFKKEDFTYFCSCVSIYQNKVFQGFVERGWIVTWREAKRHKSQSALFELSPKGKKLCKDMHLMCTGEKMIPENNKNIMTKSEIVLDKYYLKIMKTVNKKRKS